MNRPVLITGATSGIGQATTRELSDHGYDVFATYRAPRDRDLLAEIPRVHPVQLDVGDSDQIRRAISEIDDVLGDEGLYAVINNAGITYSAPFELAQPDRVQKVIDVNLMAPYLVTQASLPLLRRHNAANAVKARVINVASWAGQMASPFIGSYNATKYGLIGLTESMYYDLSLLDIHAVLAVPGVTKTSLLGKTTDGALTSLDGASFEDQERYRPYLEHFATMSEGSNDSRLLRTPTQVAEKISVIVGARRPRFRYNLSPDAKVIDAVVARFFPFRAKAALNRRMYRLNQPRPELARVAVS